MAFAGEVPFKYFVMEYIMKAIISTVCFLVVYLQTEGDFAIHEDRKKDWHLWKGVSLALLGLLPLVLWAFMEPRVRIQDYIFSILLVYLSYRWLFFDILMNERLEVPLDFIGSTSYYAKILHRIFPKQQPQGYLWIRFVVFFCWNMVWWFRYVPGVYFKPIF